MFWSWQACNPIHLAHAWTVRRSKIYLFFSSSSLSGLMQLLFSENVEEMRLCILGNCKRRNHHESAGIQGSSFLICLYFETGILFLKLPYWLPLGIWPASLLNGRVLSMLINAWFKQSLNARYKEYHCLPLMVLFCTLGAHLVTYSKSAVKHGANSMGFSE